MKQLTDDQAELLLALIEEDPSAFYNMAEVMGVTLGDAYKTIDALKGENNG